MRPFWRSFISAFAVFQAADSLIDVFQGKTLDGCYMLLLAIFVLMMDGRLVRRPAPDTRTLHEWRP